MDSSSSIPDELLELQREQSGAPRFTIAGFCGWAYCSDVYDGDTCQLSFAPVGMERSRRWTCRLARIETAEIGRRAKSPREEEAAEESRAVLQALIERKIVYIEVLDIGAYHRPTVEIYVGGANINNLMLERGGAVVYGTNPLPWS